MIWAGIIAIISGITRVAGATYVFIKDWIRNLISLMPRALQLILFLFIVLLIGGSISNYFYNLVTDYECLVDNGETFVFDINNKNAFESWQRAYFNKLYVNGNLSDLGLNDSQLDDFVDEHNIGQTDARYGLGYLLNKIIGIFDDEDENENSSIYCYEIYSDLKSEQRIELGLSSSCGIQDVPEPEIMIPVITDELEITGKEVFYPICELDSESGAYVTKLSLFGFDLFDFWTWFYGLVVSVFIMIYYRWKDMIE